MFRPLRLGTLHDVKTSQVVPPIVVPLLDAARRGEDVVPVALSIVRSFGFDGLLYAVSLSVRPRQESRIYLYSTWPNALTQEYDQRAYIEVDPRVADMLASVVPVVWDQELYRGRSAQIDAFLDVMQRYGIASGIMAGLRDNRGAFAALSLSSAAPDWDDVRRLALARHMGDILMFQRYFHELFVSGVLNELIPPFLEGGELSNRERQCLTMAASGLTGEDIALKLSISPRTVQNHFDSIRSKLGAANRQEAVFRAAQRGYITP